MTLPADQQRSIQALTTAGKTRYLLVVNITLHHLSNRMDTAITVTAFRSVLSTKTVFTSSK